MEIPGKIAISNREINIQDFVGSVRTQRLYLSECSTLIGAWISIV